METSRVIKDIIKGPNTDNALRALNLLDFLMRAAWRTQYIIASHEWQDRLFKLINRKTLAQAVRDKIAAMIQCYAIVYSRRSDLPSYAQTFHLLQKKGYVFPPPERAMKTFIPRKF